MEALLEKYDRVSEIPDVEDKIVCTIETVEGKHALLVVNKGAMEDDIKEFAQGEEKGRIFEGNLTNFFDFIQ